MGDLFFFWLDSDFFLIWNPIFFEDSDAVLGPFFRRWGQGSAGAKD